MKLLRRIAIGLITLVTGSTAAWAQGWAPLPGPYDGAASVAPSYGAYGIPASTGLVTVYALGQGAGFPTMPLAGWTSPGCRPMPATQPTPYAATYAAVTYAPATCTPASYAPMSVAYRPAVTVNYTQPSVAYSPVPAAAYLPGSYGAQPMAVGPRVWVKPKVYVEGQPVRNLLRAITP